MDVSKGGGHTQTSIDDITRYGTHVIVKACGPLVSLRVDKHDK